MLPDRFDPARLALAALALLLVVFSGLLLADVFARDEAVEAAHDTLRGEIAQEIVASLAPAGEPPATPGSADEARAWQQSVDWAASRLASVAGVSLIDAQDRIVADSNVDHVGHRAPPAWRQPSDGEMHQRDITLRTLPGRSANEITVVVLWLPIRDLHGPMSRALQRAGPAVLLAGMLGGVLVLLLAAALRRRVEQDHVSALAGLAALAGGDVVPGGESAGMTESDPVARCVQGLAQASAQSIQRLLQAETDLDELVEPHA